MVCKRQEFYNTVLSVSEQYNRCSMMNKRSSLSQISKNDSNYAWSNKNTPSSTPRSGSKVSCCAKKPSVSKDSKVKFGEVISRGEASLSDEDFDYEDVSGISNKSSLSKKTCACSTTRAQRRWKILNFFSLVAEVCLMGLKKFPSACAQVVSNSYAGSFQRNGSLNNTFDMSNRLAFCSIMNVIDMVSHLLSIILRLALIAIDSFMLLLHVATGLYCDSRNWWKKKTLKKNDTAVKSSNSKNILKGDFNKTKI